MIDYAMVVTLEEAKRQLNIDEYFTDDDNYILSLIEVCEDAVQKHARCNFEEGCPKTLKHAVLLLVSTYYLQRESVSAAAMKPVPHSFDYLIDLEYDYTGWC